MAICGFDYAIRIILLHLYVHKCQVLNMYVSSHPVYLCFIISFWFVSFHVVARLLWLTFFLYICLFLFKRIIKNCAGCISHAGEQIYTSTRTRSLTRSHARTHANHIVSFMLSHIKYLHKHAEHIYLTRLSLDLCACASFSCILFITHRLFFDFRCLTAQSAYATHCVCLLCCAVWWHSTVANTNTNISNAWQLSIFGIMIESGNKNTKCVRRAFAWTIS